VAKLERSVIDELLADRAVDSDLRSDMEEEAPGCAGAHSPWKESPLVSEETPGSIRDSKPACEELALEAEHLRQGTTHQYSRSGLHTQREDVTFARWVFL
jgi:hypothetical protein